MYVHGAMLATFVDWWPAANGEFDPRMAHLTPSTADRAALEHSPTLLNRNSTMSEPTRYCYPSSPSWDEICGWAPIGVGRAVLQRAVGIWEYGPEAGPNLRIFVNDSAAGFLTDELRWKIEEALSDNPEGIVVRAVVWEIGSRRARARG